MRYRVERTHPKEEGAQEARSSDRSRQPKGTAIVASFKPDCFSAATQRPGKRQPGFGDYYMIPLELASKESC
jgi:hypothetical protein